jgi:fatty-acyl-CoA synthase
MMRQWQRKTLWQALEEAAEENPENLAIILHDNRELTYRAFKESVERFATGLLKLGIEKGDKISIWCPNCLEWVIAKFAIASIGAVVVPVNTRFKLHEISYILSHSDSSAVIIGDRFLNIHFAATLREILPEIDEVDSGRIYSNQFPFLKYIICTGDSKHAGILTFHDVNRMGNDLEYIEKLRQIRNNVWPEDPVNMLYTSGTTGMPKGVILNHFLLSNAFFVGEELRLTREDRLLLYLPFNHCFAIINGICGCVTHGSTMVLMDPFDAEISLQMIERHRVTVLFGVPTMYLMQIEHPRFKKYSISSLRTGMIGGAGAPATMIQKIMDSMGISLISTYGMTETSCAVTQTRYGDSAEVISETVGAPLPHMEIKVLDVNTKREVPDSVEGELCIRGYSLTQGYYKNEEETKRLFDEEGWLHSGDIGTKDHHGYFRITGRIKDLIIRGGENIAPAEVESFIYQHPDVSQVQVFGIPDERFGEAVAAAIILREGSTATAEGIITFCKGRIASFKIPSIIEFVSEFPMTSSGKIKKFELKRILNHKLSL